MDIEYIALLVFLKRKCRIRAGDVSGVNKGGHGQSGATADFKSGHILTGTYAGEAER